MEELDSIQRLIQSAIRDEKGNAVQLHKTLETIHGRLAVFQQQHAAALDFCVKPRTFEENLEIWDTVYAVRLNEMIAKKSRVELRKSESAAQLIAALLMRAKKIGWEVQLIRSYTHFIVMDANEKSGMNLCWFMFFIWSKPPCEGFMERHVRCDYNSMIHEL